MSRTWYGNLNNRLAENRTYCDEITVGTGMTEYHYSDRDAYEVVEVKDQKHVSVRELDHKHIGEAMTNTWELSSNEQNPVREIVKRGNYWYWHTVITSDILDEIENETDTCRQIDLKLYLVHNNIDPVALKAKGMIHKYYKANVSFGVADYHFDYEF